MSGRVAGAARAIAVALAAGLAVGVALGAGEARSQQAAASGQPPTTEQLRQAIEEIRRRLARPPEGQPAAETALAAELKAANARIAELNETLARLRSERDALTGELELARAEGQRLSQTVGELDGRAQALEQRLAELVDGRAREVARLSDELATLKARAEQAERAAGGDAERAARLEAELAAARGEAQAAGRALAEAGERLARAEQQRAERQSQSETLAARLATAEGELAATRDKARAEAEAGARRLEDLTGRLEASEAVGGRLQREVDELRAIAATSVGEMQSLGEQLLRVLAENQTLLQTVEQVRAARELALAELGAARRDAELYAAEAARLRGQRSGSEPPAAEATAAVPAKLEAALEAAERNGSAGGPLSRGELAGLRAVEGADGAVVTVVEGTAFQFGSEQLTDTASGSLLRVGRLIDLVQPSRIRFVGHTDSQGDDEANRRLSQRRAQAVRDFLVRSRGLDSARTRVEGRGEEQPIASNDTPEGRRANRRVEVILER